jgi:hypothetical protein
MSYTNIGKEAAEEFQAGQGTVGLTPQPIEAAGHLPVSKYVIVKADLVNANDVFVGTSTVSATTGFRLDAGEATPPIHIDDLSKVFVLGGAASQGYSWLAV